MEARSGGRLTTRGLGRAPDEVSAWAKSLHGFGEYRRWEQAILPTLRRGFQALRRTCRAGRGQRDIKRSSPCLMAVGQRMTGLPPTSWNTGGCSESIWPSAPNLTCP